MALKMKVDTLDGIDENLQGFYVKQDDGTFTLDVDGHEKNENQAGKIPKHRLDQEIEKRKKTEAALAEVAEALIEDVPEDKRELIPDLSPADKIKWLRKAGKAGLWDEPQAPNGPDSRRPGKKAAVDFSDMNPAQIMAHGYGK